MKICPNCGHVNEDNRDICTKCTANIKNVSAGAVNRTVNNTDIIVTKSDTIDNYKITKYLGTVTGTDIYLVGGVFGGGLANQENLFGTAYNTAEALMINKAKDMGANAIISIQTSVACPGDINNIIVIAQGTAVYIEKN